MQKSLKKRSIIYFLFFIILYLSTVYIFHSVLDVNKYIESIAIALIPLIILFFIISINESFEFTSDFLKKIIIPITIVEKIIVPAIKYFSGVNSTLKNPSFPDMTSFELTFGFPQNQYLKELFIGNVGGIMWYNICYIIVSLSFCLIIFVFREPLSKFFKSKILKNEIR